MNRRTAPFTELDARLEGELRTGDLDRFLLSTDGSIFQVQPAAVAYPAHRADARLKIVLVVATVLGIALLPVGVFGAYLVVWLVLVGASAFAQLGPLRLVRGSWVVLPFVLVAVPLLFTRPGDALAELALGPLELTITDGGLIDMLSIMAKSWLSVQAALLLAYTTPFADLVDALRALRIPAIIVSIISFMYRYLAVLTDEAARMSRARQARSAAAPQGRSGGSLTWRNPAAGPCQAAYAIVLESDDIPRFPHLSSRVNLPSEPESIKTRAGLLGGI